MTQVSHTPLTTTNTAATLAAMATESRMTLVRDQVFLVLEMNFGIRRPDENAKLLDYQFDPHSAERFGRALSKRFPFFNGAVDLQGTVKEVIWSIFQKAGSL